MRILAVSLLLLVTPALAQTPIPAPAPTPAAPRSPLIVRHPEGRATGLLGRPVFDTAGDDIGRIVDVLVDPHGRPLAAVVDVGGFLGIGTRRVAVAWDTLRFTRVDGAARIGDDLTMDEVAAAPEYRGGDAAVEAIGRRPAN